jgi:hypothetical protein
MSTITAFISIGNTHPNDGGLWGNTNARLEVTENSKMCLHLHCLTKDGKPTVHRMIPSIKNTIYDAYLMMAYVLFDWRDFPNGAVTVHEQDQFIDINVNDPKQLDALYKSAIEKLENMKVVISILNGSTLLGQLPLMKNLPYSVEVLVPVIVKERNQWNEFEKIDEERINNPLM